MTNWATLARADLSLEGSRTSLGEKEKAAIPDGGEGDSQGQAMGRRLGVF